MRYFVDTSQNLMHILTATVWWSTKFGRKFLFPNEGRVGHNIELALNQT